MAHKSNQLYYSVSEIRHILLADGSDSQFSSVATMDLKNLKLGVKYFLAKVFLHVTYKWAA